MEQNLISQNTQNNYDFQSTSKTGVKVIQYLLLASDRMGCEIKNIENVALDVYEIFNKQLKIEEVEIAITNGSSAKYGVFHKLTSHIVCYWLREFIKERNKKNIDL